MRRMSCLAQLNWLVLLCCMVSYMLRVNLAITIVVMSDSSAYKVGLANQTLVNNISISTNNTTKLNESSFKYDPWKQNMILGSFFWGYVLTELPGGRLGEVVGPRKVIGFSVLIASILTLFTPVTSDYAGYYGLLILRALQGLALGAIFPSLYPLAAKWVPPTDRGKFMSNLLALSLGAAVTYPLCGLLISWKGWQSVFYTTGSLGIFWTIAWFWFVYDSPSSHPRISAKEKTRLEKLIGASSSNKILRVPWMKLIKSGPVWGIILTHTCVLMNYTTLSIQLPTFIKHVFKTDIKEIGFYSSLPHLGKYIVGLATGYLAAAIASRGLFSTMTIRRIFLFISTGIPGVLMIIQAHTGYIMGWTIFNIGFSVTLNGAVTGGHLCGGLDIAPNFAGTIFGLANTLGSLGSSLSAYFVGHMTSEKQTFTEWRAVFWMLGGTYLFSLVMYSMLGSANLQEWNMPKIKPIRHVSFDEKADKICELQPMNMDTKSIKRNEGS